MYKQDQKDLINLPLCRAKLSVNVKVRSWSVGQVNVRFFFLMVIFIDGAPHPHGTLHHHGTLHGTLHPHGTHGTQLRDSVEGPS